MSEIESTKSKKRRGKKSEQAAVAEVVETTDSGEPQSAETVGSLAAAAAEAFGSVDWNESTAGFDFTETESSESAAKEESGKEQSEELSASAEEPLETSAEDEDASTGFESESEISEVSAEFIEHERLMSIVESLLFSTDKPVSVATIKQVCKGSNIRSKDIAKALDLLSAEYASASRGVTLEEINGGYQLRTKPDNAEFLRRLAKVRPFRLSGPALEVMAIVAYKQPITKHEIDEIRGVESGHLLRALMERGLVNFGEKSDLPGKPMTYNSTRKFLETFGLRNIRELPSLGEIDELLPEGIGEPEEEKETLSDLTDQMSHSLTSSYSEGEDELLKINDQLKAVDTTSEFFEQEKQRERDRRDRERAQDIREKIVFGDPVEEKDQRWLDRYEAKLAQPAQAVPQAEEPRPEIRNELSELTATSQIEAGAEESEEANEVGETDGDSDLETSAELEARPDWDDEAESEEQR